MANWDNDLENQVNEWLGSDCNCKFIGFSLTSPSTSKIIDSVSARYDLILGFDSTTISQKTGCWISSYTAKSSAQI